jgi:hypothetical protein
MPRARDEYLLIWMEKGIPGANGWMTASRIATNQNATSIQCHSFDNEMEFWIPNSLSTFPFDAIYPSF